MTFDKSKKLLYNHCMTEKTTFEYRVLANASKDVYQIHIVYLDKQGIPVTYEPEPVILSSDDVETLSHLMIHAMSAFTKPVIDYSYFNATTATINTAMGILKNDK